MRRSAAMPAARNVGRKPLARRLGRFGPGETAGRDEIDMTAF